MIVRRYLCRACRLRFVDYGPAGHDRWCAYCGSFDLNVKESDE